MSRSVAGIAALGDILVIDETLPVGQQMAVLKRARELVEGGKVEMGMKHLKFFSEPFDQPEYSSHNTEKDQVRCKTWPDIV